MILGYIKVAEPKYALRFFELALVLRYSEIIFFALALTDKLRIALQITVDCIRYSRS